MDDLGLAEAAERLGVSRRHVNDLVSAGVLPGRKVSGVWLVPAAAVTDYQARRRPLGRTWSPQTAWATLFVLSGVSLPLPARTRARVRQRLSHVTGAELARAVGGRSRVWRFHADGAPVQQVLVPSGMQAELIGSKLIGTRRVDGYLRPGVTFAELAERFLLIEDPEGPDVIREGWDGYTEPLPAVVAADLAVSADPRESDVGVRALDELLGVFRQRAAH